MQAGGGGATLGSVSLNLDNDSQISLTVRAPAGKKFFIAVPSGATPFFLVDLGWWTHNSDSGTSLSFTANFQGLQGSPPTFTNSSGVGVNNQFFTFNSDSDTFTNNLTFSAITFTVQYSTRQGHTILTYPPYDPRSGIDYNFQVVYSTNQNNDPGGFVSIVPELKLTSAVSRKTHGGAVTFDVNLPLSGAPAVECRSENGVQKLVFTFTNDVVSGNVFLTLGPGGTGMLASNPTFSGKTMTVDLVNVSNAQVIIVSLFGVTDVTSQILPNTSIPVGILAGDVSGNGTVNSSDVSQAKIQSGVAVTGANFRADVIPNAAINSSDIGLVKSKSGTSFP